MEFLGKEGEKATLLGVAAMSMPHDDFFSVASLLLPLMIRLHPPSVNVSSSFFEVNGRRKEKSFFWEEPLFSILPVFLPDAIAYRTRLRESRRRLDSQRVSLSRRREQILRRMVFATYIKQKDENCFFFLVFSFLLYFLWSNSRLLGHRSQRHDGRRRQRRLCLRLQRAIQLRRAILPWTPGGRQGKHLV